MAESSLDICDQGTGPDALIPGRSGDGCVPSAEPGLTAFLLVTRKEAYEPLAYKILQYWGVGEVAAITVSQLPEAAQGRLARNAFIVCDPAHLFYLRASKGVVPWVLTGNSNALAMQAFAAGADGFLEYPCRSPQLQKCLERIRMLIKRRTERRLYRQLTRQVTHQMHLLPEEVSDWVEQHRPDSADHQITFRSDGAWYSLPCTRIVWVEAAGDYMCVYTEAENHIIRITMAQLCKKLCPHRFERVNRSVLVNRAWVQQVMKKGAGYWVVLNHHTCLQQATRLKISRRYLAAYWQQQIK